MSEVQTQELLRGQEILETVLSLEGLEELEALDLLHLTDSPSSASDLTEDEASEVISKLEEVIEPQGSVLLHMFTGRHLRLEDNTALYQALANNPDKLYTIYILEESDSAPVAPLRWKFMIDCLEDLRDQLTEYGLKLYCLRGDTMDILNTLINQWKVTHISINMDADINLSSYNESIRIICHRNNIQIHEDSDSHRLLWLSKEYQNTIAINKFRALLAEAITAKQTNTQGKVRIQDVIPSLHKEQLMNLGTQVTRPCPLPSDIPQLASLFPPEQLQKLTFLLKGGERYTQQYMNEYRDTRLRRDEGAVNVSPILAKAKPISPYLRFGCITPRKLFQFLIETVRNPAYSRVKITSVMAGLAARDFALQVAQMQIIPERIVSHNKICLPIPWDNNLNVVEAFNEAKTGFPFFDAAIRQVKTEGFAVNEVTEVLATFVTNSLLWITWEEGVKLFYENNINFDLPLATFTWLEASASTMLSGKQKAYHDPMLFASQQMDPDGAYIRKFLPVLRDFPNEYIHKPERAPLEVQQAANCIIGVDYPKPVFEYTCRNGICCQRMQVFMDLVDTSAHAKRLPYVVEECKGKLIAES